MSDLGLSLEAIKTLHSMRIESETLMIICVLLFNRLTLVFIVAIVAAVIIAWMYFNHNHKKLSLLHGKNRKTR